MTRIPYCGAPPAPDELWARWNFDPLLAAALVASLIWLLAGERRAGARRRLIAGWAVAALALVSPLCALSVSLFSARVAQHLLLALVAAPLIASAPRRPVAPRIAMGAALFAIALWVWHTPPLYQATFDSDAVYWLMHATTLGAALLFWRGLFGASPLAGLAAGAFTALQMSLLGAAFTFAPVALFDAHRGTTLAFGLAPLADQQLGGLLMWAPGGALLAAIVAINVRRALIATAQEPAGRRRMVGATGIEPVTPTV